jgi:hypothetical protein
MAGPRDYSRTTIFALARLGGETCYWPDPPCTTPVMVLIKGRPVRNVQIAHIRAAKPDGPRFVNMTDKERADWANLILLCTPHHTMVDKIKPEDYPIETLELWKSNREKGSTAAALSALSGITEDRLQELISNSMKEATDELKATISRIASVDPDAAMLLREAARAINPDTADILHMAARSLSETISPDTADILNSAARSLSATVNPDNVNMLYDAADILRQLSLPDIVSQLHNLIPRLNKAATDIRNAQDGLY